MSGIGVLREQLCRFAQREESDIFGAVSPEGEILSAALLGGSPSDGKERLLLHIYVKPKWRGQDRRCAQGCRDMDIAGGYCVKQ